jgi:hypothetical protein
MRPRAALRGPLRKIARFRALSPWHQAVYLLGFRRSRSVQLEPDNRVEAGGVAADDPAGCFGFDASADFAERETGGSGLAVSRGSA